MLEYIGDHFGRTYDMLEYIGDHFGRTYDMLEYIGDHFLAQIGPKFPPLFFFVFCTVAPLYGMPVLAACQPHLIKPTAKLLSLSFCRFCLPPTALLRIHAPSHYSGGYECLGGQGPNVPPRHDEGVCSCQKCKQDLVDTCEEAPLSHADTTAKSPDAEDHTCQNGPGSVDGGPQLPGDGEYVAIVCQSNDPRYARRNVVATRRCYEGAPVGQECTWCERPGQWPETRGNRKRRRQRRWR
jgi:hypothetical protein